MKNFFDENETENPGGEWGKVLVKVVPFVLIIVVLAVTLIVNRVKKDSDEQTENLQQSIMDYADENRTAETSSMMNVQVSPSAGKESSTENEIQEETEEEIMIPSPTPYKEIMEAGKTDYSKVKFDKDAQLQEMMAYWEDNNQQALDDLAKLDHYIAMSWQLKGTTDFYYCGDVNGNGQPEGKGIAVYADNQYYYGTWENGVRSGTGTWIHYHVHETESNEDLYTYHHYTGSWKNDLPDGEGSEHYDFNTDNFKENIRYTSNLIGSYAAGLVHGEFYITTIDKEEKMSEWEASADHGSWIYQNDNADSKGNRTVHVDIHDPDNYIWINPKLNNNIGVPCLISKNKN